MKILIDGDLYKVYLTFKLFLNEGIENEENSFNVDK